MLILPCWIKNSADDILKYFENRILILGSDNLCRLSPEEKICMKCQILFSGEVKKKIKKEVFVCRLLNLPNSVVSVTLVI